MCLSGRHGELLVKGCVCVCLSGRHGELQRLVLPVPPQQAQQTQHHGCGQQLHRPRGPRASLEAIPAGFGQVAAQSSTADRGE